MKRSNEQGSNTNTTATRNDSNHAYIIVDTDGLYCPDIMLLHKDLDKSKELEWLYYRSYNPSRWHGNKALAEVEVEKLRAVRDLAGLSKELDWKVIYASHDDLYEKNPFKGMDSIKAHLAGESVFTNADVPKGNKTKLQKALKEINRRFSPRIAEINRAWRAIQQPLVAIA